MQDYSDVLSRPSGRTPPNLTSTSTSTTRRSIGKSSCLHAITTSKAFRDIDLHTSVIVAVLVNVVFLSIGTIAREG